MNEIVAAIMDAAERRMRIGGFNGFSFREIAADVGVKSSSVHYHFPTKENSLQPSPVATLSVLQNISIRNSRLARTLSRYGRVHSGTRYIRTSTCVPAPCLARPYEICRRRWLRK